MPPRLPSKRNLLVFLLTLALFLVGLNKSTRREWTLPSLRFVVHGGSESAPNEASSVLSPENSTKDNSLVKERAELATAIDDLKKRLKFFESAHQNRLNQMEKQFAEHVQRYHQQQPSSKAESIVVSKGNHSSTSKTDPREDQPSSSKTDPVISIQAQPSSSKTDSKEDQPPALENGETSKPQSRRGLTRMSLHGVEFMDNWRPVPYQFTDAERQKMWDAFGADSLDSSNNCSIPGGRAPIATRAAYHGLGMNLLQLCNYIIYASQSGKPQSVVWIPLLSYDTKHNEVMRHAFQNWFDQHFSLLSEHSSCDIFESVCNKLKGRCYDGYWQNPHSDPRMDLW